MALDVYLKIPTDPDYSSSEIEVEDELFNFVQYIEMILTTQKGEVFGSPNLGASLESYLWNPNISASIIKREIIEQIKEFCPRSSSTIPFDIDVNFVKGEITDSILVDIEIDGTKVLGISAIPTNN